MSRRAELSRETKETSISVTVDLDGRGECSISTGLGFLNHMLDQIGRHGRFNVTVSARGDLAIDPHHTVEDVAIVLGRCFGQALGERKGIVRMGEAIVPLDEALAMVAVDLGGRGYAVVETQCAGARLGDIDTDLVRHFLETFAVEARINLHALVLRGANDHHKVEATFKALARALDKASRPDTRVSGTVPSTKGVIGG